MIIGVSGKARSGKGEFANIAAMEFGATVVSFAAGVKEEVAEWLDTSHVTWREENLYGSNEYKEELLLVCGAYLKGPMADFANTYTVYFGNSKYTFTARSLMQWWGTEYRRKQDPEYWVKLAMEKCQGQKLYVIDDVRFPNEVDAVSITGGTLVRIERRDRPGISNSTHPSEVALDDYQEWHHHIDNGGTLEEYRQTVREVLGEIVNVEQRTDRVQRNC